MSTPTHKEVYPEQYTHKLVGKKVRTQHGVEGTVLRVMRTRFGDLADLGTVGNDGAPLAYSTSTLTVID